MGRFQKNKNSFFNANRIKREGYVPLNDRLSTEWDMRLDLSDHVTITSIVDKIKLNKSLVLYVLVSGIELGTSKVDRPFESEGAKTWTTTEPCYHVHIALVTKEPILRLDALNLFREKKIGQVGGHEYCVIRKPQYSYAGWVIHHNKEDTKQFGPEPAYEYGTLPMDPMTPEAGKQILNMARKYKSRAEEYIRFAPWIEVGKTASNEQAKRKRLEMGGELERLRKRLKEAEEEIDQLKQKE